MLRIAFCDDDLAVLNELNTFLDKYRTERRQDMVYAAFRSPLELLAQLEKGMQLDILFLDVLMPGENGIEAAKEIRQYDRNVKIIFLTSSCGICGAVPCTVPAYLISVEASTVLEQQHLLRLDGYSGLRRHCARGRGRETAADRYRSKDGTSPGPRLDTLEYAARMSGRTPLFRYVEDGSWRWSDSGGSG